MAELLENRYRIIRELAEGGFGKTFIAEDTQMPSHRRCVIKELKPLNEGSQIYELIKDRFHREAVILEDLGNNNNQIPSLYAHFYSEGKFYLVQEYIEGETLAERIQKQGKLSEATVKEILTKLLNVLDFIHSKKIIHRDIKPENIILRSGDDTPVLIDFGAVREIMGTVMSPSGNSTSSIVIGTPGYMPAEQLAGRPIFASDLYALALTMIYGLTSKIPSELPTDPLTGKIGWLQNTLVSPTMANILDKAIATYAQERFPTASIMLQALQGNSAASTILLDNGIDNQPTPPPVPPTVVFPQEDRVIPSNNNSSSNNNLMVAIIALLVLIGFGGLGFFMYQQNQLLKTTLSGQQNSDNSSNIDTTLEPTTITNQTENDSNNLSETTETIETIQSPEISQDMSEILSQDEALSIVQSWYNVKPQIFAPPFDYNLVAQYATGKLYYDTTQKDGGGSIGWLYDNGCYYTYDFSNINQILSFNTSGIRPSLTIQVTEELQLHGPKSAGCGNPPKTYTKNATYWFEQENGVWKIYHYDTY